MQTKYLPRIQATGLSESERKIIDTVIKTLGDKSATELSDLSHMDKPWIEGEDRKVIDLSLISQTDTESSQKMGRSSVAANSF